MRRVEHVSLLGRLVPNGVVKRDPETCRDPIAFFRLGDVTTAPLHFPHHVVPEIRRIVFVLDAVTLSDGHDKVVAEARHLPSFKQISVLVVAWQRRGHRQIRSQLLTLFECLRIVMKRTTQPQFAWEREVSA